VPDAAEIDPFVRQLQDRRDDRIAVDPLHEGVGVRLADGLGEGQLLGRRQVLVAEHQHVVPVEQRAQGRTGGARRRVRQIEAADLQADGRRQRFGLAGQGGHETLRWPCCRYKPSATGPSGPDHGAGRIPLEPGPEELYTRAYNMGGEA